MLDDYYFYLAVGGFPPVQSFSSGKPYKFSGKKKEKEQPKK